MKHMGIEFHEELPEWAKITSQNISFEKRARVQATIQKYVDTAISSTFNVNADADIKEIEDIYMVSWKYGLKGATVFRDKCKKAGILSDGGQTLNYNPAPFP
jgi:ribonucleoside-diphosphate reductase alpha chain